MRKQYSYLATKLPFPLCRKTAKSPTVFSTRLHIVLTACLTALLIWSSLASTSQASSNSKASGLFCNPSGQAASSEAQTQIAEFLALVGETNGKGDNENKHHCPDCFITIVGLPTQKVFRAAPAHFPRALPSYFSLFSGFHFNPTGPPLGGRAPPLFL